MTPEEIGRATLERLAAQAMANRAAGERRLAEVRSVWEKHPELGAKELARKLTIQPLLSIRRVQELLQKLRAEPAVSR